MAGDRLAIGVDAFPGRAHNDLVLWIASRQAVVIGDALVDFGRGFEIRPKYCTTASPARTLPKPCGRCSPCRSSSYSRRTANRQTVLRSTARFRTPDVNPLASVGECPSTAS
jgi:hypothetical protein